MFDSLVFLARSLAAMCASLARSLVGKFLLCMTLERFPALLVASTCDRKHQAQRAPTGQISSHASEGDTFEHRHPSDTRVCVSVLLCSQHLWDLCAGAFSNLQGCEACGRSDGCVLLVQDPETGMNLNFPSANTHFDTAVRN